jgi:hypothetical protein
MKLLNTKGFSLLHVLPAVLIILGIAAIGARVITQSHAAQGSGLYCTSTWKLRSSDVYVST